MSAMLTNVHVFYIEVWNEFFEYFLKYYEKQSIHKREYFQLKVTVPLELFMQQFVLKI